MGEGVEVEEGKERSKEAVESNCKDKVKLRSTPWNLSSVLHAHHRIKGDTGSNKEGVSSFRGKRIR